MLDRKYNIIQARISICSLFRYAMEVEFELSICFRSIQLDAIHYHNNKYSNLAYNNMENSSETFNHFIEKFNIIK